METFQLRYFESVVRHGSLTAAAVDCHVSQPSLSTQIKKLETELGARLLERKPRGVVPTRAGERLLLTARRLIAEVDACRRDVRRRHYAGLPELRIGIQPFLAAVMLPEPLARFLSGHDSHQIVVRELPHDQLAGALTHRTIDLGLTTLVESPGADLETRTLFNLTYGIFCPVDHPLTRLRRPRLNDLLPHRLALYHDPAEFVDRISRLGTEAGTPARIMFSSDQALTVLEMAAGGLGVTVLPTLFRERARRRKLVMLPLPARPFTYPVAALWPRGALTPPGFEAFLRACTAASV